MLILLAIRDVLHGAARLQVQSHFNADAQQPLQIYGPPAAEAHLHLPFQELVEIGLWEIASSGTHCKQGPDEMGGFRNPSTTYWLTTAI